MPDTHTKVGLSYRQHQSNIGGPYDAIVIGSGIGGLGAAAFLSRYAGKRVLVLERHYTAGGFTTRSGAPATNGTWGFITSATCFPKRANFSASWTT